MSELIHTLKTVFLAILFGLLSVGVSGIASNATVYAQNESAGAACESLGVIDGSESCEQKDDDVNINNALETALNLLSFLAGVVAVVMIMLAGTRYITSQGDSQKVTQARNAIIYAAAGIIVVAMAQIIVRFVIGVASSES